LVCFHHVNADVAELISISTARRLALSWSFRGYRPILAFDGIVHAAIYSNPGNLMLGPFWLLYCFDEVATASIRTRNHGRTGPGNGTYSAAEAVLDNAEWPLQELNRVANKNIPTIENPKPSSQPYVGSRIVNLK